MINAKSISIRFLLSLCMLTQSINIGWAEIDDQGVGRDTTNASEAMGVTANQASNSSEGIEIASSTPPKLVMGGITLPKQTMTMDFQDADVKDVLHLMALKSGLNIIYGTDVTGPITLHLDKVPFDQAFQTILTLKSLVALPLGPKIIRVVTSSTLTTEQSQATTFTRVFRLNYALAEDVKKPIDSIRSSASRKGVSTVDVKTNSLIITDTIEGLKEIEDLIPVLDKKPQQVDIESKIVEVALDDQFAAGISWAYAGNTGQDDDYRIGVSQNSVGKFGGLVPPTDNTGVKVLGPGDDGGTGVNLAGPKSVGFSFLTQQGTYLLSAQISALATKGKAKVLSSPHIVTTNNQEATINVSDQIPYKVQTVTNSTVQESVQFVTAGVKLTVKPTVNADRRITLKVKPEVSNPKGTGSATLPPTVNTRNADTTVVLRDGETIAIGGLIKEQEDDEVTGIPFLMSIPILGYLFKSVNKRKTRLELIVFITPKIAAE